MSGLRRVGSALLLVFAPQLLSAQGRAVSPGDTAQGSRTGVRERLGVEVGFTTLRIRGESEFFALVDQALTPGASALRPRGGRGSVMYRLSPRWTVRSGISLQERAVESVSRARPSGETVAQRTSWSVTTWDLLGGEWLAWQRPFGSASTASARAVGVALTGGIGTTRYTLRQEGRFVDATRSISYADDFRSSGRGVIGHFGAMAEVTVHARAAVRLDWRMQIGSAPMTNDFAGFDRLDLGGQQFGVGVIVHPFRRPAFTP